jgi:hypothetical protein
MGGRADDRYDAVDCGAGRWLGDHRFDILSQRGGQRKLPESGTSQPQQDDQHRQDYG